MAITDWIAKDGLCIIRINKKSDINQIIENVMGDRSTAGMRSNIGSDISYPFLDSINEKK